jgi:nitrogen fixation NifU-like protein
MNTAAEELQEIYRHRVLEHSKRPHHFHRPARVDLEAQGFNPLCGDKITFYLQLTQNQIEEAAFEGTGCAICIASASMLTDALSDCSLDHALMLLDEGNNMLTAGGPIVSTELKDVEALAGVRKYSSRVKCATLAWNTARAALDGTAEEISTETDQNV